jgi:lipopolysaccharide biosynthesis glycosyltransferase
MKKITIAMACDEEFAMPLATALRSIVDANRTADRLEIYVLSSEFSPSMRQKVLHSLPKDLAEIHWVHVDLLPFKNFSPPEAQSYLATTAYVRLLLPQFLPDHVSKVLYLDADILVFGDLGRLWEVDLEGFALGAVADVCSEINAQRLGLGTNSIARCADLQTAPNLCEYFNSGVLLVDLERWRQDQISEKAMQYMTLNPHTLFADQDGLNVACDGRWKKLNDRWNLQNHSPDGYFTMRPEQRPSIAHFTGKWKPWHATMLNVNANMHDSFRRRTQFARTPVEIVSDAAKHSWALLKRFLKQHQFISQIHSYIARPKTSG